MGGVAIGIQSNPETSCIVVGAVRVVLDIAINFVCFFKKLTDMICEFEDYLAPLADYATASHDIESLQEMVAMVYGDLIEFCRKAYTIFMNAHGHRRKLTSFRVFFRHQWVPFESEFGSMKAKLDHHLGVLQHSAQASLLNFSREADKSNHYANFNTGKERSEFLDWISKVDFEKVHDDIYAKKHGGTGAWLLQRTEFEGWLNSQQSSLLWCYGKPGAGKSVLASNVLEHITTEFALHDNVGISFAYYNYREPELGDSSIVVGALIKQLCQKKDCIPSELLRLRHDSHSNLTASNPDSFVSLAKPFREVFIVLDALDECPEHERHRIIGFIDKVVAELQCAKIFITSRREADIVEAFEGKTSTVQIEAKNVAADIALYVRDEVAKAKLPGGWNGKRLYLTSDKLQGKIIDTLVSKADGMFLWVNLQLESLCWSSRTKNDQQIEDALEKLPNGLDDTYDRLVHRIECQIPYMRDLAINSLMCVIYAKEPLEARTLQAALATAGDKSERDARDYPVEVILDACCGLLEEANYDRLGTIRPIHFSVQEFFTDGLRGSIYGGTWDSIANPASAHQQLSRICLRYLQTAPSKLLEVHYKYPFAGYAAQFFDYHLFECGAPDNILPLVDDVLSRDSAFLSSIFQLRKMRVHFRLFGGYTYKNPGSFPLSAGGIIYATRLYEISSIRTRWAGSTPPENALHHASSTGLLDAVGRLLEQGCDVNERDNDGVAAIHHASEGGHDMIIELLLGKGADINAQGGDYGNALQAALHGGHDKTVELLLSKGADVNA
ncbi:uncharacterized protein K441DRAFT_636242, partial [Cenococcum geophilum 1.58]|uniref:uncharacterized protein n=1 Tax=Cenococcum geophilum 1.58 TaxID=794803 RepID=UPI00358F0F38